MPSAGQNYPVSKLIYMYVKKLAQPVASTIEKKANKDNFFRNYICLPPANLYHFYEARVKFKFMKLGNMKMQKVPKMSEREAVRLGASLVSECCIYSFASGYFCENFS